MQLMTTYIVSIAEFWALSQSHQISKIIVNMFKTYTMIFIMIFYYI